MKHLIIHVDEHVDREKLIKKELGTQIDWEFFPAVKYQNLIDCDTGKPIMHTFIQYNGDRGPRILDKKNILDKAENQKYFYIPAGMLETKYNPYNSFLSDSMISLAISHMNAIKWFFENNSEEYFILCEDDIKLNPTLNIVDLYSTLLTLNFDICLLSESPYHKMKRPGDNKINNLFYEVEPHYYSGVASYCVRRSCYDIIKDMNFISFAADDLVGILQLDCECKVIAPYNPLFLLNDLSKISTIDK
jgi:hypothetical protein